MNKRGRPPKPEGPLTYAQVKAAQRQRDRAALQDADETELASLTLSALVEGLPGLISGGKKTMLGAALVEIGRRGGIDVYIILNKLR